MSRHPINADTRAKYDELLEAIKAVENDASISDLFKSKSGGKACSAYDGGGDFYTDLYGAVFDKGRVQSSTTERLLEQYIGALESARQRANELIAKLKSDFSSINSSDFIRKLEKRINDIAAELIKAKNCLNFLSVPFGSPSQLNTFGNARFGQLADFLLCINFAKLQCNLSNLEVSPFNFFIGNMFGHGTVIKHGVQQVAQSNGVRPEIVERDNELQNMIRRYAAAVDAADNGLTDQPFEVRCVINGVVKYAATADFKSHYILLVSGENKLAACLRLPDYHRALYEGMQKHLYHKGCLDTAAVKPSVKTVVRKIFSLPAHQQRFFYSFRAGKFKTPNWPRRLYWRLRRKLGNKDRAKRLALYTELEAALRDENTYQPAAGGPEVVPSVSSSIEKLNEMVCEQRQKQLVAHKARRVLAKEYAQQAASHYVGATLGIIESNLSEYDLRTSVDTSQSGWQDSLFVKTVQQARDEAIELEVPPAPVTVVAPQSAAKAKPIVILDDDEVASLELTREVYEALLALGVFIRTVAPAPDAKTSALVQSRIASQRLVGIV